jgi:hypothetical protein
MPGWRRTILQWPMRNDLPILLVADNISAPTFPKFSIYLQTSPCLALGLSFRTIQRQGLTIHAEREQTHD